jgi:hypothetical protein
MKDVRKVAQSWQFSDDHGEGHRYSERKETGEALIARVNQTAGV